MIVKRLTHILRVTLPYQFVNDHRGVQLKLQALTGLAGGCTLTGGMGQWLDSKGQNHVETVNIYTWYLAEGEKDHAETQFYSLVRSALALGEKAVLIETSEGVALITE